jgi:dinuclear metal center YbgI/SA1388 family protein
MTMKLAQLVAWLDETLQVGDFDDVSNNSLQIARVGEEISRVAFAVDASLMSIEAAGRAGAQLLVVHHGISWGGGIKRIEGGIFNVVRAAMDANLAVYACHLPLDAHEQYGNNRLLSEALGLERLEKAFSYHGNVIGFTGELRDGEKAARMLGPDALSGVELPCRVGVCSGGAGEFAEAAQKAGCRLYVTGEASWGDVVAAENCGMKMVALGHYETETYGVNALAKAVESSLGVETVFLDRPSVL